MNKVILENNTSKSVFYVNNEEFDEIYNRLFKVEGLEDKLSNYAFKLFVSIGFVGVLLVEVIRSGYRSALKMGINFF